VFCCSVKTGEGIQLILQEVFQPEKTSVIVGSSGVGKSSLINTLVQGHQKTSSISQSTGKGKHTTTTRDMFLLENGSIVIDTPGMREFGVGLDMDGKPEGQFPAIEKLAAFCKYADCSHLNEEGCKLIEAYEDGQLDPLVYQSFVQLTKEQKRFLVGLHEKKQLGKQFGKMVREAKAYRKKYKY
jgi:ribosome biogenesis GTPase / thiamine phosphate phosphatase